MAQSNQIKAVGAIKFRKSVNLMGLEANIGAGSNIFAERNLLSFN
jgi:hypothetical protein